MDTWTCIIIMWLNSADNIALQQSKSENSANIDTGNVESRFAHVVCSTLCGLILHETAQ